MNNVIDVETYVPQDGDKYFFDANIWLYFYCPIGNHKKEIISKYSGFLKRALSNDTTIYVSSLIASEIINAWLRLDFNILRRKKTVNDNYKKHYRGSSHHLSTAKNIQAVFNNQLLKISTPLDDRFTEISLPDILSELDKTDFNDCYYHHLARLDNLLIVTDDVDFAELDTGISILTANQ
ncbi:MAG: PIN domain-containing protein, partial [Deltaproteobacteria bacterium]|nr:PIN domain-containing protein [Deltaproteobacteria bacterium]